MFGYSPNSTRVTSAKYSFGITCSTDLARIVTYIPPSRAISILALLLRRILSLLRNDSISLRACSASSQKIANPFHLWSNILYFVG